MKLKYVSITGADDDVSVADLNRLSADYPFAEWAVLLMPERMGGIRFPSEAWIRNFTVFHSGRHKAMHLCGSGLIGFLKGEPEILDLMRGFGRIQLNLEFGDVEGQYRAEDLIARVKAHPEFQFIVQYTDKRRDLLPMLRALPNHALLFDGSAGRGVLPDRWPAPLAGHVCGYAGGINPDNVGETLEKIAQAAGNEETWIDMESGVRTQDRFDLEKVCRVLTQCAPFVA